MTRLLLIFMCLFPFIIDPWTVDKYYTNIKADFLMYAIIVLWVYHLAVERRRDPVYRMESALMRPADWLLFGLAALLSVSTLLSQDIMLSVEGDYQRREGFISLFAYLSLFYFASRSFKNTVPWRGLLAFSVASTLVSLYGILQHFQLDFIPRSLGQIGSTRSFSLLDNPNFLGTYTLLMVMIHVTCCLIYRQAGYLRPVFFTSASVHFLAMLYTLTRSAYLGFVVAYALLSLYLVLSHRSLLRRWLLLTSLFAALSISVNVAEAGGVLKRMGSIWSDTNVVVNGESAEYVGSSRGYIWKTSMPLLQDYWLIGSGPDTFGLIFPHDKAEIKKYFGYENTIVNKAHNEYLQLALTAGIPVLLLYLGLVLYILRRLSRHIRQGSASHRLLCMGVLATITGYLVQAFFNISVVTVAPYYWILLGIGYSVTERGISEESVG